MKVFTFARYNGKEVMKICHENPSYCLWAHSHVPFFNLTEEQKAVAEHEYKKCEEAKAEWAEEVYGFGGNGLWDI